MDNITYLEQRLSLDNFEDCLRFPVYFEIETINACNAGCRMCTVNEWQKSGNPLMDDAVFNKVADEIISNSNTVKTVNLSRDGEPLLDKKLVEKIYYLKKGGVKNVAFSTNASLLSEKWINDLLNSPLDELMFSIDGYAKVTYEKIRKGLDYDKVIKNVKEFIKLRDSTGSKIRIRVRMVIQEENEDEVEVWGNYWRGCLKPQDLVHAKYIHSWGNQLDNYVSLKDEDRLGTPCTSPFSTMVIRYNGDVTVCPIDYDFKYVNGNVKKDNIQNIWMSGIHFRHFRDFHMKAMRDEYDFCKGCRLWEPDIARYEF
tara:strand:+ start:644 stop:1582 length:939 start_codon:yes stop_codon:yes gene_type:complete